MGEESDLEQTVVAPVRGRMHEAEPTNVINLPRQHHRRMVGRFSAILTSPYAVAVLLFLAVASAYGQRLRLRALVAPQHGGADGRFVATQFSASQSEARQQFVVAFEAYRAGRLFEAVTLFEQAAQLDPAYAQPHRALGIVFAQLKDEVNSIEHYRQYLALAPEASDAGQVQRILSDYAQRQN